MKKIYMIIFTSFLFLQLSAQITPSTYRQVFNYEVGDTFEYNLSSINSPFQGMERWEYSMVVILGIQYDSNSVTYTIQSSDSGGTRWEGTPPHVVLNSGQDTTTLFYSNLDSSIFCHDPYFPSGLDSFTQFPYTDTVYLDSSLNYKKIDYHMEGTYQWSYIDTIYGDSIGYVRISCGFESDNSGQDWALIYYHKANGQRWGTHHPFRLTSSILNPDPESLTFQLYPNPGSNQITIGVNNTLIGGTAIVTDITGREIFTVKLESANTQLITSYYPQGVYFVRATKGEKQAIGKLVIK